MANGKCCIKCLAIISNACLQCYHCGALQLAFYAKEERKSEDKITSNERKN